MNAKRHLAHLRNDSRKSSAATRRLSARIGGLSLHVQGNSDEIAARARQGLDEKFRREALAVAPDLTGTALERKIKLVKSLYYSRLALKSARSRSRKAMGKESP